MKAKVKKVRSAVDPKGVKLPSGNPTLRLVRKVDPETLAKRLQPIYRKLVTKGASRSALLSTLAGDNRHKRWSVRILLKMKLVEAVPEPEPTGGKPKAKRTAKVKPAARPRPRKQPTRKPAEEPKPQAGAVA